MGVTMLHVVALLSVSLLAEAEIPSNDTLPKSRDLSDPAVEYNLCPIPDQEYPYSTDMVPSYCVCMHCKGPKGTAGPQGGKGVRGPPGRPGYRGMKGSPGKLGHRGPRGFTGMKGQKGAQGARGRFGLKGTRGFRGFRGPKGDKGIDGSRGTPGRQGLPGLNGQCPSDCISDKGDTGEKGDDGMPGPIGVKGESGMDGISGSKGEQGIPGSEGVAGLNGLKGDQGMQGICDCVDGEKGEPGNVGDVGPQGNMGPQGVLGEKGDMGEKGSMGETGNPGPCSPNIQSAFSAARAIEDGFPNPYYPIPFKKVFYNNQKHFNPAVGVYTAPVNGTYVFSYHLSISTNPIKMALFKNRVSVVKTANIATKDQASQMIFLYLVARDKIWLQVKDSNDNGMYVSSETDSTFSGFLLYPDNCDQVVSRMFEEFSEDTTMEPIFQGFS